MDVKTKLMILDKIYQIYDKLARETDLACKTHCSTCCTRNVTMTSLESYRLLEYMTSNKKTHVLKKLEKESEQQRFIPEITTNTLAAMCAKGDDPPDEDIDHLWGACPFLQDNLCTVYEARPFGCRCFTSKIDCSVKGYAEVDPFDMTVNHLFLQYIEHIDANGYYGNLTDMVQYINVIENQTSEGVTRKNKIKKMLLQNQPITTLLIPQEHKEKIQPIIHALNSINLPK
jgi:Fe-S-cluster containining protein